MQPTLFDTQWNARIFNQNGKMWREGGTLHVAR